MADQKKKDRNLLEQALYMINPANWRSGDGPSVGEALATDDTPASPSTVREVPRRYDPKKDRDIARKRTDTKGRTGFGTGSNPKPKAKAKRPAKAQRSYSGTRKVTAPKRTARKAKASTKRSASTKRKMV
ncbi:MAG: hypothetical protein QNL12_03085 [Acidimicrobiia bacterium]|nr:hypothetical protein [Acidimicrobiia bacterium]